MGKDGLISSLINNISKPSLENSSNDAGQYINLPNTLDKFDLYNKLAKSMYLCLIGAFANLFIIVVVYFVPLVIKRAEHLLPNKAVSLLNWVLRY